MIKSFGDKETELIYNQVKSKNCIWRNHCWLSL